jgi:UDP-N-acetylglucosamine diphosphorylase/glucosamine-1-phosphate N-acetyltransferase
MIILSDKDFRQQLFPFTQTRHAADIRVGILTIREKWEQLTNEAVTTDHDTDGILIPANLIPTLSNFQQIIDLALQKKAIIPSEEINIIEYPWHIFQLNDYAIREDFKLITKGRTSQPISNTNKATNPEYIFIEEGASVEHSILNAATGPIYIGKNAIIMEGNLIRGPFSLGENSVLKMGSKVYGATTLGPYCIGGGEIKNSVLFAHSNKAHDGYLGDSVLGEWCNMGAGTSNSNVKNTGGDVGYIFGKESKAVYAGNKAGLLMGDYSRAAINTSFNTGSVVGVCCNVFGDARPGKFTENFTWGNERYIFDKAIKDIDNWKKMKGKSITQKEIEVLKIIYDL